MFNSPFDSFHNTVSEAKKEREQLDRLLTISTPRERLLVGVIAVLLVILAIWLFFGDVTRSLAVEGVLIESGEGVLESSESVQALVWVGRGVAPQVRDGMRTTLEVITADGRTLAVDGKIVASSAVPVSESVVALESAAPVFVHRIDIVLDRTFDFAALAGRDCRVVIELGTQSPAAFLGLRQP